MQGVSDNVHVDDPLFCAAWRFRSIFSSQWQVEIIQSARDVDIPLAIKLARRHNGHKGDSLIRREPL